MSGIGESRTELLTWLNELLQLNFKKVEECGTGAPYCQIMDSIYGDVQMHRVKFDATAGYEFQTNYKILQSCFARHQIEKTVYVERLIKCKFQDNLEFLQWIKKYWLQNKDERPYDAASRRKKIPLTNSTVGGFTSGVMKRKVSGLASTTGGTYGSGTNSSLPNNTGVRSASLNSTRKVSNEQLLGLQAELSQSHKKVANLNKEVETYKEAMDIMERERDFYFGKLRDIEILVQSTQDLIKEGVYNISTGANNGELNKFLSKVQHILYATEDGFEANSNNIREENEQIGQDQIKNMNIDDTNNQNNSDNTNNNYGSYNSNDIENTLSANNNVNNIPSQNLIIDEETF